MNRSFHHSPQHGALGLHRLAMAAAMLSANNAFADVESPHNFGRPDTNDDSSNTLLKPLSVNDVMTPGMALTGSPHFVTGQHLHFDADLSSGTLQFGGTDFKIDGRIPDTCTVVLDPAVTASTAGAADLAARTLSDAQDLALH